MYGMFLLMLLYWQNILCLHGLVAWLFPWNALKIDLFVSLLVFTDRRIPTWKSGVRHLKIEICWNYTPTTQKKTKHGRRGGWDVQGQDECDHQLPPLIPSRAETGKRREKWKVAQISKSEYAHRLEKCNTANMDVPCLNKPSAPKWRQPRCCLCSSCGNIGCSWL